MESWSSHGVGLSIFNHRVRSHAGLSDPPAQCLAGLSMKAEKKKEPAGRRRYGKTDAVLGKTTKETSF